jgi:hypothetical protein
MASAKVAWSQTYSRAALRDILADAVEILPEEKRTPSLTACLAEKILTLAADCQENPTNLRRVAIKRVLDSCPYCRACDGLQSARNRGD